MRQTIGSKHYVDVLEHNVETDCYDILALYRNDYHDETVFAFGLIDADPRFRPSHQATGDPIPPPKEIDYVYSPDDKFVWLSVWRFFFYFSWMSDE